MSSAIIGYTGFVGSTLDRQTSFSDKYNSVNIENICGKKYDLIVCAGAPAAKWIANKDPISDLSNIERLESNLKNVVADKFILISTIDVYKNPNQVNEDTPINPDELEPYGRHRYFLERFIVEQFQNNQIVRLPGLFGEGIKKNFVYDLIHNNVLHLTHSESVFQLYDMVNLWTDLEKIISSEIPLINLATEPIAAKDIALQCFDRLFGNITEKPPAYYDMQSKYAHLWHMKVHYMYSAEHVIENIRVFAESQKRKKP